MLIKPMFFQGLVPHFTPLFFECANLFGVCSYLVPADWAVSFSIAGGIAANLYVEYLKHSTIIPGEKTCSAEYAKKVSKKI